MTIFTCEDYKNFVKLPLTEKSVDDYDKKYISDVIL